jgi:RsmE family RNA methyltransferase
MIFYIPKLASGPLSSLQSAHIWSMRLGVGDNFQVTDLNGKTAKATIKSIDKKSKSYTLSVTNIIKHQSNLKHALFQAITDKVYLDKLVELLPIGLVNDCYLFLSKRSLKYTINQERLKNILIRSCEQSEIVYIPKLHIVEFGSDEFVKLLKEHRPRLMHCDSNSKPSNGASSSVLVGPEGGWSDEEIEYFGVAGLDQVYFEGVVYPAWVAWFRYFCLSN